MVKTTNWMKGVVLVMPDYPMEQVDLNATINNKYCYKFLLSRCSKLCWTTGHDKAAMAAVVSLIDEATEQMRMQLHITPTWIDIKEPTIHLKVHICHWLLFLHPIQDHHPSFGTNPLLK
jgi:hypothetical protein